MKKKIEIFSIPKIFELWKWDVRKENLLHTLPKIVNSDSPLNLQILKIVEA